MRFYKEFPTLCASGQTY